MGRRYLHVRYNPSKYGLASGVDKEGRTIVARGAWGEFVSSTESSLDTVNRLMRVADELEGKYGTSRNKGLDALYLIATIPEEQREQSHTIPSTGEVKKVDEMTVRELREVKAE